MLPQFSNVLSHNSKDEAVYKALFEITFDLPPILGATATEARLLLENALNITLPMTPDLEIKTQRFKFSTRAYVTLPPETHLSDVSITFNINENDNKAVFVWNTLKAWYDLAWNSQTGETHTKREMTGNIIINQHNKKGQVIRRVTYKNTQIIGLSDMELNWDSTSDILDCTAKFIADYWEDIYIPNN
jgi:hypothetical protein